MTGSGADTRATLPAPWWRWAVAAPAVTPLLRWVVLVHAVPVAEPWRAGCPHCSAPLAPVAGGAAVLPAALRPGARCGACRRRIGAPPYLLEAAAATAAALVVVAVAGGWRSPWEAAALSVWAAFAVALSFIDLSVHRLPDRLTLPAAGLALAWLGGAAISAGAGQAWVRAAVAAALCGLGFAVMTLIFGARGFGPGDAKLALGAGALLGWAGWAAVAAGLVMAFVGSGVVAVALLVAGRAGRHSSLPFGPFLAAATLGTLAWVT